MPHTVELSDDLVDRIDQYRDEDQTYEEFLDELISIYETEGIFLQEGYSE